MGTLLLEGRMKVKKGKRWALQQDVQTNTLLGNIRGHIYPLDKHFRKLTWQKGQHSEKPVKPRRGVGPVKDILPIKTRLVIFAM